MDIQNPYTLQTIYFVGGSSNELVFHGYFEVNKRPHDFTGCTADFSIINYVNRNGEPLVSKEMKVGRSPEMEDGVQNILRVTLDPEDTVDLPAGKYIYQISIRDANGNIEIPGQGIIHLINNIHKGFVKE